MTAKTGSAFPAHAREGIKGRKGHCLEGVRQLRNNKLPALRKKYRIFSNLIRTLFTVSEG